LDGKTISSREHVTHVYLVINRRGRRIELLAHGTRHWSVRVRALPRGRFAARLDAVDALHQHHYS
jgi:hypothetical protein